MNWKILFGLKWQCITYKCPSCHMNTKCTIMQSNNFSVRRLTINSSIHSFVEIYVNLQNTPNYLLRLLCNNIFLSSFKHMIFSKIVSCLIERVQRYNWIWTRYELNGCLKIYFLIHENAMITLLLVSDKICCWQVIKMKNCKNWLP